MEIVDTHLRVIVDVIVDIHFQGSDCRLWTPTFMGNVHENILKCIKDDGITISQQRYSD